jgi:signal transduction histidine kinase
VAEDDASFAVVREVVHTYLPSTRVERLTVAAIPRADPDCVILNAAPDGQPALDTVRELRARGYGGGLVLLADSTSRSVAPVTAQLGALLVRREAVNAELPDALLSALEVCPPPVAAELSRARRMISAGEIAVRLQHSLNNPLGALLAELQLLEMEQLPTEQRLAVRRMLELCRRTIATVKRLDFPES